MANQEQLEILKQGVEFWNKWRKENKEVRIDLSEAILNNIDLEGAKLSGANLRKTNFSEARLSNADLSQAILWGANLVGSNFAEANLTRTNLVGANLAEANLYKANFFKAELIRTDLSQANLSEADLLQANLYRANLYRANLWGANLIEANLIEAKLVEANLGRVNFYSADLSGADLSGAALNGANLSIANLKGAVLRNTVLIFVNLVGTYIDGADISNSQIYGVNVWDLVGKFREQNQLIISKEGTPEITVDNIKVAQFVYLILNNSEIRGVLNTLTTKSVLILGRFADPSRKAVLDGLRNKLREFNLLPIVFDFERPDDKDYTETVQTLAGLCLFVIVDVTSPKSTPLEMEATVKQFKIPFVPIIDISVDPRPYAMIVDSQNSFHWVLPTFGYESKEQLLDNIEDIVINRALKKHNELREQKAKIQETLTLADLKKGKK